MSQAYYHGKDKYSEWRRCDPCAIKRCTITFIFECFRHAGNDSLYRIASNWSATIWRDGCRVSASGAVGSVVGQIAKIKGAKVVGIAGGKQKTAYLTDELGFDAAIDYKQDDFAQQLEAAVPDGIDVYFENVGGAISDEVFKYLNRFARVPVCGAISAYNNEKTILDHVSKER